MTSIKNRNSSPAAPQMTLKERIFYGFVCNERRVYRHWYTRFLLAGVDLDRIVRVVSRIPRWRHWCAAWFAEGEKLERMAEKALAEGDVNCARRWFHEAAGCFQVGQHFFYFDDELKRRSLAKIWDIYPKAVALHDEATRPQRVEIPFGDTSLPGYLRLQPEARQPLVIQINGLDNLKECEQHTIGEMLVAAGFNALVFEGPGQGEMWERMKMIPNYQAATTAVIDWIIDTHASHVDVARIGVIGFSMGGFFGPLSDPLSRLPARGRHTDPHRRGGKAWLRYSQCAPARPANADPAFRRRQNYSGGPGACRDLHELGRRRKGTAVLS